MSATVKLMAIASGFGSVVVELVIFFLVIRAAAVPGLLLELGLFQVSSPLVSPGQP